MHRLRGEVGAWRHAIQELADQHRKTLRWFCTSLDAALNAAAEWRRDADELAAENERLQRELANIVRVGVAVIVRREDGRILMGQRKGPYGGGTWSVPGGKLDRGESALECAARELEEETGIHGVALRMLPVVTHDHGHPAWPDFITLWAFGNVPLLTPVAVMEPEKCAEWRWVARADLPEPLFRCFDTLLMSGVDPWRL